MAPHHEETVVLCGYACACGALLSASDASALRSAVARHRGECWAAVGRN